MQEPSHCFNCRRLDDVRRLFDADDISCGAGGAGLNSLRAVQRLAKDCRCWIVGLIGADAHGRVLVEKAQGDLVRTELLRPLASVRTGTCVCLIHGGHRSLVASPDAGNAYAPHFIDASVVQAIRASTIVYITGFFLACCPRAVRCILDNCSGKQVMFNFSAGFVGASFAAFLREQVLARCTWVVGNVEEVAAFLGAGAVNQVQALRALAPGASIVITDGPRPVSYYDRRCDRTLCIPIPAIPEEEIVDTNGAGDAFVGGLLASFLDADYTAEGAVLSGSRVAAYVIRHSGIQLPPAFAPLQ